MFMRLLLLLRPSLDQAACGWTLVGEGVLALLRRQATADGRLRESLDRLQSRAKMMRLVAHMCRCPGGHPAKTAAGCLSPAVDHG